MVAVGKQSAIPKKYLWVLDLRQKKITGVDRRCQTRADNEVLQRVVSKLDAVLVPVGFPEPVNTLPDLPGVAPDAIGSFRLSSHCTGFLISSNRVNS